MLKLGLCIEGLSLDLREERVCLLLIGVSIFGSERSTYLGLEEILSFLLSFPLYNLVLVGSHELGKALGQRFVSSLPGRILLLLQSKNFVTVEVDGSQVLFNVVLNGGLWARG